MKNRILIVSVIIIITINNVFGQEIKKSNSKMDDFISKTGVIMKFIDYSLPNIKTSYGIVETKIRKLISSNAIGYFYQISYKGKYDTKTASIALEDLVEIIKALETLNNISENDKKLKPDYLENKFITDDGFQLGYYIENEKLTWYLVLEKFGSGNTIFIKDISIVKTVFLNAKSKIDELKL